MRVPQNAPKHHRSPLGRLARIAALVLCVTVAAPAPLFAQGGQDAQATESTSQPTQNGDESNQGQLFNEAHRKQIYRRSRLSTTTAVLYNLALPGLGNVYAEQYFTAGLAFSLMVFAAVFVSYGLVTRQTEMLWIGAGTAAIAYPTSIVTSIFGVREYNTKLRQGLKLDPSQVSTPFELPRAPGVQLRWRF